MGSSKCTKKRVALASKHEFWIKRQRDLREGEGDKLSELPDELLISILSLLTITEAVRTSTLSRRWERFWISYHGDLDFDIQKRLWNVKEERLWQQERSKYISYWTKHVFESLLLLGSPSLTAFIARLDEQGIYRKGTLSKIFKFVMAKKIKQLELDFTSDDYYRNYSFPSEFCDWIQQPCGLNMISALTSLTLKHIAVNGETIEFILSNSPLLERLCVIRSSQLPQLKVSGAAVLSLKHLMIEGGMDILEVSAPNLLSLHVFGNEGMKLHVENVPKLVDVSVYYTAYMSSSLSQYLSQFQTLFFGFHTLVTVSYKFSQFVASNKLKHLVLKPDFFHEADSLLGWTSLIEACPFLQKFTLDLTDMLLILSRSRTDQPYLDTVRDIKRVSGEHSHPCLKVQPYYRDTVREIERVNGEHCHPCLKVVEIVGFTGITTEIELAIYFLENSSKLEQIIIDRRCPKGTPYWLHDDQPLEVQQNRALQLKRYLPPGVELLII